MSGCKQIAVEASEVWRYFYRTFGERGEKLTEIANNPEFGVSVYISSADGYPCISVFADDDAVFESVVYDEETCREISKMIYEEYLTENLVNLLSDEAPDEAPDEETLEEMEFEVMITEREDELDLAIDNFLYVVLDGLIDEPSDDYDAIAEDCKEHFLEYIARKHELPVRRPMFLEYEDGEEFEEYPYENMEFEDEDNPIYKKGK